MKINTLEIKDIQSTNWNSIDLNSNVSIFYSEINSTGKTTLMRALLYAMGFSVPGTELVSFDKHEFRLIIVRQGITYNIHRKKGCLEINGVEYDLSTETKAAHATIFGTSNPELLENILAVMYFDQEKGWTLLNRGRIVGHNKLNVESFFRGMQDDESDESYKLVEKINTLDKKIKKYKLLMDIAQYQDSVIAVTSSLATVESSTDKNTQLLAEKRIQLLNLENEIKRLDEIIKQNKSFGDYLESKNLYLKNPTQGPPIAIKKSNLLAFSDMHEINIARRAKLRTNRDFIKKDIAKLLASDNEQVSIFDGEESEEDRWFEKISNIKGLDAIVLESQKNKLIKEKKKLEGILKERTKNNNEWINKAYSLLNKYACELGLPDGYTIDIFTNKLKGKSGAILHKYVFMFKLTYIALLSEKLGYRLPIFCDSPSGREIEPDIITQTLQMLNRDFSENQLIIASINKFDEIFSDLNIITCNKSFFNNKMF